MTIDNKGCNSFFETTEWLNIVAGNDWNRICVNRKDGSVEASIPVVKMKKYGCKVLGMPTLTQTLGIYIEDTGAKLSKKLEREKKMINKIIDQLPRGYSVDIHLDVDNQYILPFLWRGFNAEPRYTYRIEDLSDLDNVWKGFRDNVKTDIRKSSKIVTVEKECSIDLLIDMQRQTFERQGRSLPYDEELIRNIDRYLVDRDARVLLCAIDADGNCHAAAYFVFDNNRCYYLIGGGSPAYRNSGATSLLIWEGIKIASERSEIFDFEGSMIEDIERFVRAFGAKPRVYYRVKKFRKTYAILDGIKPVIKKIIGYK